MAETTDTLNAFRRELANRESEYNHAIERGVDMLHEYGARVPSTHLGHNLANVATDLSVIAGKIELTKMAIRTLEAEAAS